MTATPLLAHFLVLWGITPLAAGTGVAACWLYGRGVVARHRTGRHSGDGMAVLAFAAGVVMMVGALSPPLENPALWLLSVHMVQHVLLLFAPLLLMAGRPGTMILTGLPPQLRGAVAGRLRRIEETAPVRVLLQRPVAWGVLVAAVAVWHLPGLYEAAARSDLVHSAEHASFLLAGTLFWMALLGRGRAREASYGGAILSLFTLALVGTAFGAILTFSSRPWYAGYAARATAHGVDPVFDQQIAGLVMWIPTGLVFLVVSVMMGLRWLQKVERTSGRLAERGVL
jgi:putative membrane protein